MQRLPIPLSVQQNILDFCQQTVGMKLAIKPNILFPNSVYITDLVYTDIHPEKFILIFDFRVNYYGKKAAEIKYFQIPRHLRHIGLATKIYHRLESQLKKLGCQEISVNAVTEKEEIISFWEHLNFKKSPYCFLENEVCPMTKQL